MARLTRVSAPLPVLSILYIHRILFLRTFFLFSEIKIIMKGRRFTLIPVIKMEMTTVLKGTLEQDFLRFNFTQLFVNNVLISVGIILNIEKIIILPRFKFV